MASITQTSAFSLFKSTTLEEKILCPFTYVISNYSYTKFHSKQKLSCHRLLAKYDDLAWNNPSKLTRMVISGVSDINPGKDQL
jgi:hypothetical protein